MLDSVENSPPSSGVCIAFFVDFNRHLPTFYRRSVKVLAINTTLYALPGLDELVVTDFNLFLKIP